MSDNFSAERGNDYTDSLLWYDEVLVDFRRQYTKLFSTISVTRSVLDVGLLAICFGVYENKFHIRWVTMAYWGILVEFILPITVLIQSCFRRQELRNMRLWHSILLIISQLAFSVMLLCMGQRADFFKFTVKHQYPLTSGPLSAPSIGAVVYSGLLGFTVNGIRILWPYYKNPKQRNVQRQAMHWIQNIGCCVFFCLLVLRVERMIILPFRFVCTPMYLVLMTNVLAEHVQRRSFTNQQSIRLSFHRCVLFLFNIALLIAGAMAFDYPYSVSPKVFFMGLFVTLSGMLIMFYVYNISQKNDSQESK